VVESTPSPAFSIGETTPTWQGLNAAQIVVVPVASHGQAVPVQPAMALLHTMFVATVNRTDEQRFRGGSFVADPFGEIIGPVGSDHDELVIRSLDLDRIDEAREARCSI
jgi:predicted amidohydrolase